MGIKLGAYGKKPEYNTDEYLKKFIPLVVKHAPEFDNFSLIDLTDKMKLSNKEKSIYNDNEFLYDLKIKLKEVELANVFGNGSLSLTDKGRDKKNGTEPHNRLTKYQRIYLPLFIFFGLFGIYKTFFPSISKSDYETSKSQSEFWKHQSDSLMTESRIYKDSVETLNQQIELYKKQSIIDTSKTKN